MIKVAGSRDVRPGQKETIMGDFDAELVARGRKAVLESLREAELSLDADSVASMFMARQGHGRSA